LDGWRSCHSCRKDREGRELGAGPAVGAGWNLDFPSRRRIPTVTHQPHPVWSTEYSVLYGYDIYHAWAAKIPTLGGGFEGAENGKNVTLEHLDKVHPIGYLIQVHVLVHSTGSIRILHAKPGCP
jgi:hypothetical protein